MKRTILTIGLILVFWAAHAQEQYHLVKDGSFVTKGGQFLVVGGDTTSSPSWIIADGLWNNSGVWDDSEIWYDSAPIAYNEIKIIQELTFNWWNDEKYR